MSICKICAQDKEMYPRMRVCKECHKNRVMARYNNNKDTIKAQMIEYNRANRNKLRINEKNYYNKNKSLWQYKNKIRKNKIIGDFNQEEWMDICTYYNKCLCCGSTNKPLTIDHIFPIVHGGLHVKENIQPLCRECNSKKGKNFIDYR
jgi:5-methylcytosine-specific restriction endonuclease McrA